MAISVYHKLAWRRRDRDDTPLQKVSGPFRRVSRIGAGNNIPCTCAHRNSI